MVVTSLVLEWDLLGASLVILEAGLILCRRVIGTQIQQMLTKAA